MKFASLIILLVCCLARLSHAQITNPTYSHSVSLNTNYWGVGVGDGSSEPQANLSCDHFTQYSPTIYVHANATLTATDVVTNSTIDWSGTLQCATTQATGGAAAEEYSQDLLGFTVINPVRYTCTASMSANSVIPQGAYPRAIISLTGGNTTTLLMGTGYLKHFSPPYTPPGTITGVLPAGYYRITAEARCSLDNLSSPADNGSATNNFTFHAEPLSPPTVTAATATAITATSATLNGTVNPNGGPTTAYFEYWTGNLPHSKATITLDPTDSTTPQTVSAPISGLISNTVYEWTIVATNATASAAASGASFWTLNPHGRIQFDSAFYSVNENGKSATVVVDRNEGAQGIINVRCTSADGTAVAPFDHLSIGEHWLTWQDGDDSPKLIDVDILDQKITTGGTKNFALSLDPPVGGAALGTPFVSTVTIKDNDITGFKVGASSQGMHLQGTAAPNTTYQVQSSLDVDPNHFTNLTTVTTASNGAFEYYDSAISSQKFYRIKFP